MSEWKKYKLGELGFFFGGVTSIKKEDYGHGTPFLPYKNVYKNSKVNVNELELMNVRPLDLERRNAIYGDIFFTASSETPDEVAMSSVLLDEVENLTFNGFCKRFRLHDFNTLLPEYARYLFRDISFRREVYQLATGDIRFNISQESLANIEIVIPDLPTQRQIAQILSSLDDKIELNLQMNQTLEATAQAIFKEWFVHFNFPGFDGELVDGLPKGWRVERFDNHFDVVRGLSYKGNGLATKESGIPMYNLNSVYEGGGFKYEGIKFYNGEYKDKHIARPRDIIIANTEQGHDYLLIGFPAVVPYYFGEPAIFSHHIYRLRPDENSYLTPQFTYYLILQQDVREQIIGCSNGTTVNMLKIDGLQMPTFKVPPRKLVQLFSEIVESIWQRQENNVRENESLAQLRDTLLPKLMSGQLEVSV
ncbi:MAG: restriction endonuclease subunit S [Bacteroidia bacterium]|nr:restriction endonuclease subunit S [Bacteroidia bacterium]